MAMLMMAGDEIMTEGKPSDVFGFVIRGVIDKVTHGTVLNIIARKKPEEWAFFGGYTLLPLWPLISACRYEYLTHRDTDTHSIAHLSRVARQPNTLCRVWYDTL